tara:strand:+ start:1131 stop:1295 length:165 start_codon:yes stop_codon:yes gene_type:complete
MQYLWFLLPITVMWLECYILGLTVDGGFQWWTPPMILTAIALFAGSVFYAVHMI